MAEFWLRAQLVGVRADFPAVGAQLLKVRTQFDRFRERLFGLRAQSEPPAWPEMTALSDILNSLSDIWPKWSENPEIVSDIFKSMSDIFKTMSDISEKSGPRHFAKVSRPASHSQFCGNRQFLLGIKVIFT